MTKSMEKMNIKIDFYYGMERMQEWIELPVVPRDGDYIATADGVALRVRKVIFDMGVDTYEIILKCDRADHQL